MNKDDAFEVVGYEHTCNDNRYLTFCASCNREKKDTMLFSRIESLEKENAELKLTLSGKTFSYKLESKDE